MAALYDADRDAAEIRDRAPRGDARVACRWHAAGAGALPRGRGGLLSRS